MFAHEEEVALTNASCPGETSGGLLSLAGRDNGCLAWRSYFPLHTAYAGTQLTFAVAYLRAHPATRLISLTIGANDLFLLQQDCRAVPACLVAGLPNLLTALGQNLAIMEGAIRATGYQGRLVGVTYYLVNYRDPNQVAAIGAVNAVVASVTKQFGGEVADGFGAFQSVAGAFGADSCAAGLLIKLSISPLRCDIHPSATGHALLAEALQQHQEGPAD